MRGGWIAIGFALLIPVPAAAAGCEADKARFAVGKPYTDTLAEEARMRTGSAIVRELSLTKVYTMEFRGDRLDLVTDRSGLIVRAQCG